MKFYLFFGPLLSLFAVIFCVFKIIEEKDKSIVCPVENVGRGRASKMEYCGHSYVVWQQNLSDCIVHDPDCKCTEKK